MVGNLQYHLTTQSVRISQDAADMNLIGVKSVYPPDPDFAILPTEQPYLQFEPEQIDLMSSLPNRGLRILMIRFTAPCFDEALPTACALDTTHFELFRENFGVLPEVRYGEVEINLVNHLIFNKPGYKYPPGFYRYVLDPNTVFGPIGPLFTTVPQNPLVEFDFKVAGFEITQIDTLSSDRHKSLKIKGKGLKTVTITTKQAGSPNDRFITFYTSNVFVDLYMLGTNAECNYEGSVFELEVHPKKPHMSVYSVSEEEIILTLYPKSSDSTPSDLLDNAVLHDETCKNAILYANVTLERSYFTKKGDALKHRYIERRDRLIVGRVVDCLVLEG